MATKGKDAVVPGVEKSERSKDTETALAPVNVPERKPDDVAYAPKVNVSSSGRVSAILEGIADEFKRQHTDQAVRWVFHSARKPELSNVVSRMSEGYSLIEPKEFQGYPIDPYVDEKGMIRLGDVILMKIPSGQRQANKVERQRMADQQLSSVKDGFKSSMATVREGEHTATARGGLKLEERDHDLSYEQPSKEE